MNFLKRRAFRQGSVAMLLTVLGIVLIVLLNMVVGTLSSRNGLSIDMTENKLFEISDDTKNFLAALDKDVEIIVTNTEEALSGGNQYFVQANEVMKKYAQLSGRVTLSYVDVIKDPSLTMKHADIGLAANQIMVMSGNNRILVNYQDLFNVQTNQYGSQQIASSKAEQVMTSAILNVTSDKKIKVAVLTGHNEQDISAFTDILTANNYEVAEQNLLTGEIDPEVKVAILAAPARDLSEDELRKLDAFLSNSGQLGKTLFYMAAYDQPPSEQIPNLTAFLSEWGIVVGNSAVYETDTSRLVNPFTVFEALVAYTEDDYSAPTRERKLENVARYARPLSVPQESKNSRTIQPLLVFSSQSGILPENPPENWQPSDADLVGSIPTLALSTELRYSGTTPQKSHVLVSGSYHSFAAEVLGSTSFANSEYFLNLIDSLAEREDAIRIQDKTISYTTLDNMTVSQMQIIVIAVLFVLPLAVLITGIVVWLRRRHA